MIDPAFDSRHDLDRLFEIAKFSQAVGEDEIRKASMKMGVVILLWSNDHRFLSENALRRKFKRMRLDRGIRGDFLKELTRKLVSASQDLVTIGVRQWNSSYEN